MTFVGMSSDGIGPVPRNLEGKPAYLDVAKRDAELERHQEAAREPAVLLLFVLAFPPLAELCREQRAQIRAERAKRREGDGLGAREIHRLDVVAQDGGSPRQRLRHDAVAHAEGRVRGADTDCDLLDAPGGLVR